MASAQPGKTASHQPVTLGQRSLAALAILFVLGIIYASLGVASIVAVPRSVVSLSGQHTIGHGRVLVSGYYVTEPFVSLGGLSLPPYVFAASTEKDAPVVHVTPTLADLRAGRVVAVIDAATGNGSRWSPYVIHTLGRWNSFVTMLIVGGLIVVAFALWVAGPVAALVRR